MAIKIYNLDKKFIEKAKADNKRVVVQIAPAVRTVFGKHPKKLVRAVRKLGFDVVLDTVYGADVTIVEEANELIHKLKAGNHKVLYSSCCPGWIDLAHKAFPEVLPYISTTKSPQLIMGAIIKFLYKNSFSVSIMPCTRKAAEAARDTTIDLVLTTSDLIELLKQDNIDVNNEEESEFDLIGSGGGVLFGQSGGVMISALRYAYFILSDGQSIDQIIFTPVPGYNDTKEAIIDIPGYGELKVAVVAGLGAAKKFVKDIDEGKIKYDFVEIMACPNGCISGAGNPPVGKNKELLKERSDTLVELDVNNKMKAAQDNNEVIELYKKIGHDGAHDMFHF